MDKEWSDKPSVEKQVNKLFSVQTLHVNIVLDLP